MTARRGLLGFALALAAAGAAQAQIGARPACPPQPLRWQEDCRPLAGRPLHGLDRLRHRPLGGWASVSFGAEARTRMEGFNNPDFGLSGPDYLSLAGRALAHADLRTRAGPRLFVQLSAVDEVGREPGPRPFDVSGPDLAQGFVDLGGRVGPADVTLRLGRQELALSGNRLVGLRDGATLRRAFDMAKADLRVAGATVAVFHGRPVANGPDSFDDEADPGDRFSGVSVDWPAFVDGGRLNLFAFERDRRLARYLGTTGPDERRTYGFRYVRTAGAWDGAVQAAVQRGETSGQDVRAWGGAVELGRTFAEPGRARLAVQIGAASGDDNPGEGAVEAFDPLYPNLGVFSSAPLYFPTNQVNVSVAGQRRFGSLALRLDAVLLSRFSERDAIYANPGRPLVVPTKGGKPSALLLEAAATLPLAPRVDLAASVVRAEVLDALRAASGRDATFAQIQLTTRF